MLFKHIIQMSYKFTPKYLIIGTLIAVNFFRFQAFILKFCADWKMNGIHLCIKTQPHSNLNCIAINNKKDKRYDKEY